MEHNVRAVVRYEGTGFAGWQIQPDQRTVQGEIERVLSLIAGSPIRVFGAGRTDAGVHALGQVCSFWWPSAPPLARLRKSLSKMLGPEIRIDCVEEAPPDFHARFSAVSKRYAYSLCLASEPDPFSARYAWCIPWRLDLDLLASLGRHLVGQHDFAGFQCAGASVESTVRTIHSIQLLPGAVTGPCDGRNMWRIEFHADGFLYKMVRNITGTFVDIARGKTPEGRLEELLCSADAFRGHTAPAHGLALLEVFY